MTVDPSLPVQTLPSDEVIDALIAGIVRIKRRAEIYEMDGVTPFDIDRWDARLVGGTVTVDRTRDERRMCEVQFDNSDDALRMDPFSGFWYDKIIKIFWGIRYFDQSGIERIWETQIGEFMIDRIDEDYFPNVIKITGRDYAKKCLVSKIKNSVQFPQYTPIEDMVLSLAANAGITKFALPTTGQGYARDAVFERGTERWKVMADLTDSIGYELYFKGDGYLTMRPYGDPVLSPISWIFRTGSLDGTLVQYSRSANDSRIRNHIIVVGANVTNLMGLTETVYAERINNDPTSPTRVARIGDRTEIITSEYITSNTQAALLAESKMRIAALEEYDVNFSSLILPWLEAGDIVDIVDDPDSVYTPKRFLLSNFTFPLALGPMTGVGKRVTIVGTEQTLEYM